LSYFFLKLSKTGLYHNFTKVSIFVSIIIKICRSADRRIGCYSYEEDTDQRKALVRNREMKKLDLYWYEENDNELCGCIYTGIRYVFAIFLQGYGSICRRICIQIFTAQDGFFIQKKSPFAEVIFNKSEISYIERCHLHRTLSFDDDALHSAI
jgi:hypothetical protein